MPASCDQCQDPMLKGIHSCGIDGPQQAPDPSAPNLLEAVMAYQRAQHCEDPIAALVAHMASSGPQGVQFGCTCGSSGAHYPPCPFAPAPQATPGFQFTGWICPVCQGGVGPFVQRCPCRPVAPTSTPSIVGDIYATLPHSITKGV